MIGDAVHNMRSALDHITWAFSTRNFAVKTLKELRDIQFPICLREGEYWGSRKSLGQRQRRMRYVEDAARTRIDAMQPYHGGDRATGHPLAILNELSNEDKHHKLLITATGLQIPLAEISGFPPPFLYPDRISRRLGGAEDDAPLAIFHYSVPIPETGVNVDVDSSGEVVFDYTMPEIGGRLVIEILEGIHDFIRDAVFPPLDELF
jgi:hypothetical protein